VPWRFFSFRNRWPGGLHFGPAAWTPAPLPLASAKPDATNGSDRPKFPVPASASELATLLESGGLAATSAVNPSLAAQLRDLGGDDPVAHRHRRRIRGLVLNLLPTQPEANIAGALMRQSPEDLLAGLALARDLIAPRKVYIVTDSHDYKSRRALRKIIKAAPRKDAIPNLVIKSFVNLYPQAHPTILLRSLFGKKLAHDQLPTRANRVILDPVCAWALGRLARTGALPDHRPVQIFTESSPPKLILAKIGEPVSAHLGDMNLDGTQVIRNGMLLGEEIHPAATNITWSTEIISARKLPQPERSTPCIACGWCVDHCPTALSPIALYQQSLAPVGSRTGDALESRHCIGCSLCSYVCPTRLPLATQIIRLRTEMAAVPVPLPKEDPGDD
jgi:electron transport complex protein RnfC